MTRDPRRGLASSECSLDQSWCVSTPGPDAPKARGNWILRRLRERHWFWAKAAWAGFDWFGRIVDHPLSSFLAWVLALATIFLGGIVLHISLLVICIAVLIVFLFVVARGARLKWERDCLSVTPRPELSAAPVTYMGGEHTHFHFGEQRPDAGDAAFLSTLERLRRPESRSLPDAERPKPLQEPQGGADQADDQADEADQEDSDQ
jgi:hypothetical protein